MSVDRSNAPHDSAHTHVTGLSEYIDDRPEVPGELWIEVAWSPHAHARIEKIDTRAALAIPGVRGVFLAKDFAHNQWGTIFQDQPLLAHEVVQYAGEAVALIAAESRDAALRGRRALQIRYTPLPAIRNIAQARAEKSFIGGERRIERGDVDMALRAAPHRLSGSIVLRGADHFYLESQACIAYPREDGQIEIHASSQHPTEVQHVVAHALGIPDKDVVCIVKRMGGGFGGKESQGAPFAAYAALAARRLGRPARLVLTKDDDMVMTGKRNPFENEYTVGFDDLGRILALDVRLYSDAGAYADLSTAILERAMLHCDNAYYLPAARIVGQVCRTHHHSHTAFRGFGGPKGAATMERVIEEIAGFLGIDALDVRHRNVYGDAGRDVTPYGQRVENNCLPALFEQLERECDYRARRKEIEESNARACISGEPLAPLRGLSMTAVKFGISFTTRFLNQANALVIIHRDGTLQVSTGATEMGQGVNARIAEVVARELGLPRDQVRVLATSTERNANTSPTAASSGTDLNGAAALLATRKIKERLSFLARRVVGIAPERWAAKTAGLGTEAEIIPPLTPPLNDPNGGADWASGIATYDDVRFEDGVVSVPSRAGADEARIAFADLINEAYLNRVSLSEYAHYRIPNLSFNKLTGQGEAFLYFTQGVAASEVSVDPWTGEAKVTRTDILMDLGRPINEALDLGQVTGAFIQGMGWVTAEKLHYNEDGLLLTHAPSTYKIPSIQDTPRTFHVRLFKNEENFKNVAGTKAAGEPPLLLALSVWTAIHDAVSAVRDRAAFRGVGANAAPIRMELPATQEEVLRALWPERFAELG